MATLRQRICGFKGHVMLPMYVLQSGIPVQVAMICDKCDARTKWHKVEFDAQELRGMDNENRPS